MFSIRKSDPVPARSGSSFRGSSLQSVPVFGKEPASRSPPRPSRAPLSWLPPVLRDRDLFHWRRYLLNGAP